MHSAPGKLKGECLGKPASFFFSSSPIWQQFQLQSQYCLKRRMQSQKRKDISTMNTEGHLDIQERAGCAIPVATAFPAVPALKGVEVGGSKQTYAGSMISCAV